MDWPDLLTKGIVPILAAIGAVLTTVSAYFGLRKTRLEHRMKQQEAKEKILPGQPGAHGAAQPNAKPTALTTPAGQYQRQKPRWRSFSFWLGLSDLIAYVLGTAVLMWMMWLPDRQQVSRREMVIIAFCVIFAVLGTRRGSGP